MSDRTGDQSPRLGPLRWTVKTVGFTVGACLFVAATALLLFVVIEHGGRVVGSDRTRSLLALALFAAAIGIPTYLLAVWSFKSGR